MADIFTTNVKIYAIYNLSATFKRKIGIRLLQQSGQTLLPNTLAGFGM
jgi:predicted nucleic acid-binding protein